MPPSLAPQARRADADSIGPPASAITSRSRRASGWSAASPLNSISSRELPTPELPFCTSSLRKSGVPLRKGAHHTESIQLCWKVATILPFRPREATNSSDRPPGYEDCVNRRRIPANAFDKARQEALRICAMNSRLPRAVLFASAPELRSSLLLGVIGLLPLIRSGCGPPS